MTDKNDNSMKVGILTFHSEINYGSVLQAFALQTAIESLGYSVIIIDKWEDPFNRRLLGPLSTLSIWSWLSVAVRGMFLTGEFARLRRRIKTMRMIKKYLKRTPYHFFRWTEAPKDLGVDVVVIGSDQVWNPDIVSPADYLLLNAPDAVPGIAYAASIGQHELRSEWLSEYRAGFKRLKGIGVREKEAAQLIDAVGGKAEHVVDPTLLVTAECWKSFVVKTTSKREKLFCYLMTISIEDALPELARFAREHNADVELFVDNQVLAVPLHGIRSFERWLRTKMLMATSRLNVKFDASPDEFVKAIASAKWVVTESFHGLMFATIFRKDVRVLISGYDDCRNKMSSRLTEFVKDIIAGQVVHAELSAALMSLKNSPSIVFNNQKLDARIKASREWLQRILMRISKNEA